MTIDTGNHEVIRPRTFPAIDASLAACHFVFPRLFLPCVYRHVLDLSRLALHAGENSIFPIFSMKKGSTLQSRNMIAPLYIKQNEETAEKPNALFRCSVIKERNYAARFISARSSFVYFLSFLFFFCFFLANKVCYLAARKCFMMSSSSFG